jgi:hypothetical protein
MTTMLRSLLALALLAWLLAAPVHARERVELERWLKDVDRAGLAMGTLAVEEAGAPVWVRSIGVAGLEPRREASAQTRYRIGSVSKLFTAMLVLQRVEEGRLTLETPLARFFPTFPQAGGAHHGGAVAGAPQLHRRQTSSACPSSTPRAGCTSRAAARSCCRPSRGCRASSSRMRARPATTRAT